MTRIPSIQAALSAALVASVAIGLAGCEDLRRLRELRDDYRYPTADIGHGPATGVDADGGADTGLPPIDTGRPDSGADTGGDGGIFPVDSGPVPDVSFGEPPVIFDVFPAFGSTGGGTLVTVQGARFNWSPEVRLGGQLVEAVDVIDQYELLFVTPAMQAGTYDLKITTSDGTASLPNAFTAVEDLAVFSASPASGPRDGGVPVVVDGAGLSSATRFLVGAREATDVRVVSPARAEFVLPPSDAVGAVDIVAFGGTLARLDDGFTYYARPRLDVLLPEVGGVAGGDTVLVEGEGITDGCGLWFGTSRVEVDRADDGRLFVVTPGGPAGPVDVSVDCGERGASYHPGAFAYAVARDVAIAAVHPALGFTRGGAIVTISGTMLGDAERVLLGALEAPIVENGDWFVRVVTPEADEGVVSVTVETAVGGATAPDAFRFVAAPRFGGLRPPDGPVDGGFDVLLDGEGLDVVDAFWIDGVRLDVSRRSASEVGFVAPPGAPGPSDVVVEVAGLRIDTGFDLEFVEPMRFDGYTPASGPTTGGTVLTVLGAGFGPDCRVWVGGVEAPTDRVGTVLLAALAPPHPEGRVDVEVRGCGDGWTAPRQFLYVDPAGPPGGVSGGGIDGELSVTVIESGTDAPIAGATVMVGVRDASPWVALTDARGQVTFRDPELRGPQTVTAYAPQRSAESYVNVDARDVTLVLNPVPTPPCNPATDPECVPPPPPPTGQIVGFLTGLRKLDDPPPGAVVGAVIETTRYASGYGNPNPGPESVLFENGPFTITTRLGEMALVAQCGWFFDYGTVDEVFVPRRLGVTRGIFIRESDGPFRTAVDCNIPLDRSATFKLTNAPELVPEPTPDEVVDRTGPSYPGYFQVDADFDFGAEGHLETLPPIVSREPVFQGGGFPALDGSLSDVLVSFTAGAYDLYSTIPFSRTFVRRVTGYDRVVTFPDLLPLPTVVTPSVDDPRFAGYVEWDYPATGRVPDLYHFYVTGQGSAFPRYSVFVPGYQHSLDLADFPAFAENVGWVPRPGDVGQLVTFYIRAIDVDAFDFDDFDRYVLRSSNWRSASVTYQSVVLSTPSE